MKGSVTTFTMVVLGSLRHVHIIHFDLCGTSSRLKFIEELATQKAKRLDYWFVFQITTMFQQTLLLVLGRQR